MVNGEALVTIAEVLVYLSPNTAGTTGGIHPQKSPGRHEIYAKVPCRRLLDVLHTVDPCCLTQRLRSYGPRALRAGPCVFLKPIVMPNLAKNHLRTYRDNTRPRVEGIHS